MAIAIQQMLDRPYAETSVRIPKPENRDPLVYNMAKTQAQLWLSRHGVSSYQLGAIEESMVPLSSGHKLAKEEGPGALRFIQRFVP